MIVASLAISAKSISLLYYETIFAAGSIAIFASSTFMATGILDKRADQFRSCYLELQKIWNSSVSEGDKLKRYSDVLPRYPNHGSQDDADAIFTAWRRGGELFDTKGKVPFSVLTIASVIIRKCFFWFAVAMVF